jgi:amidase/aspartyl-tRNA(Asn)/glutamyl-tRNA(Gln) amidotransferase subunit A
VNTIRPTINKSALAAQMGCWDDRRTASWIAMTMRPRLGLLSSLASEVRAGRITSTRLVNVSLERIAAHQDLNAVVALSPNAIRDAEEVDRAVRQGRYRGSLAGWPVLIKDIEDAAGMRTTFGSALYAGAPASDHHGVVAKRLSAAGAVIVGKTNVPEFAFEGFTANRVFGATLNPWLTTRSPGGSSGGSSAALAAGLVPIATATDVGGSIRIPAALCGLVGLKPTAGLIGRDQILATMDLNNHGPLASTVADTRLLLRTLGGPAPGDPGALPLWQTAGPTLTQILATARLVPGPPLSSALSDTYEETLEVLSRATSLPVNRVDLEAVFPLGYESEDWFRIVAAEQAHLIGREVLIREANRLDPVFREYMEAGLNRGVPWGTSTPLHLCPRRR